MSYFIFVFHGSGGDRNDPHTVPADRVLEARMRLGLWPVGINTRLQSHLAEGDQILFYCARQRPSHPWELSVVGTCTIAGPRVEKRIAERDENLLGSVSPTRLFVPVRDFDLFPNRVELRHLVSKLRFTKGRTRWGVFLQGGICRIDAKDFNMIAALGRSTSLPKKRVRSSTE